MPLVRLIMVAEVGHPLKASLGHQAHKWKMYHGWAREIPKLLDDFSRGQQFGSWWSNSWQWGWERLLSNLLCQVNEIWDGCLLLVKSLC